MDRKAIVAGCERLACRSKVAALPLEFLESQARTRTCPPAAFLPVKLDPVGPARVAGVADWPLPIVRPGELNAVRRTVQKLPHHPLDPVGLTAVSVKLFQESIRARVAAPQNLPQALPPHS
jgi:hypothetical protein